MAGTGLGPQMRGGGVPSRGTCVCGTSPSPAGFPGSRVALGSSGPALAPSLCRWLQALGLGIYSASLWGRNPSKASALPAQGPQSNSPGNLGVKKWGLQVASGFPAPAPGRLLVTRIRPHSCHQPLPGAERVGGRPRTAASATWNPGVTRDLGSWFTAGLLPPWGWPQWTSPAPLLWKGLVSGSSRALDPRMSTLHSRLLEAWAPAQGPHFHTGSLWLWV